MHSWKSLPLTDGPAPSAKAKGQEQNWKTIPLEVNPRNPSLHSTAALAHSWQVLDMGEPLDTASSSVSGLPSGKRRIGIDSQDLAMCSLKQKTGKQTKYEENGMDPKRIQATLRAGCRCHRNCFQQFSDCLPKFPQSRCHQQKIPHLCHVQPFGTREWLLREF